MGYMAMSRRLFFHAMKHEYGIEPRHQNYACIVDLLALAGQLDRSYQFIMDMPIKPEMSVGCLPSRLQDAWTLKHGHG
jgi:hypothetical protein